jgi:hypothetical protein
MHGAARPRGCRDVPVYSRLLDSSLARLTLVVTHRDMTMELYVFSSKTLTNIWAGVGARRWAVSLDQAEMAGARTKARNLRIGAVGILYCVETHALTTPFIVSSVPDQNATVTDVWPEEWHVPFKIHPLGSPHRQLAKDEIARLPAVASSGRQWNNVIRTQGQFAFQPSTIGTEDWEIIFQRLAVPMP